MVIRKAELDDIREITELTCQLGYPADVDVMSVRLERLLAREDQLVVVAFSENQVCGWLQAHACEALESGFRVEIVGLVVAEASRRRGIGRMLVESAETWALEKGSKQLVVRSNTKRAESHSFYPALGFSVSKTQSVYQKKIA